MEVRSLYHAGGYDYDPWKNDLLIIILIEPTILKTVLVACQFTVPNH